LKWQLQYFHYIYFVTTILIQLSELGCPWQYFVALWVNFQSLVAHGNISLPLGQLSELGCPWQYLVALWDLDAYGSKESTETYLLELTPYKGLWVVICLLNGH